LLDIRCQIPCFVHITDGLLHDVNVLDILDFEADAFYVMDRGCTLPPRRNHEEVEKRVFFHFQIVKHAQEYHQ
jgi:hypothetical protein